MEEARDIIFAFDFWSVSFLGRFGGMEFSSHLFYSRVYLVGESFPMYLLLACHKRELNYSKFFFGNSLWAPFLV